MAAKKPNDFQRLTGWQHWDGQGGEELWPDCEEGSLDQRGQDPFPAGGRLQLTGSPRVANSFVNRVRKGKGEGVKSWTRVQKKAF